MTWPWYCEAPRATLACPCNRQSGAHIIQDWPSRNAATVRSPTKRIRGLRRVMRSKVATSARERQAGGTVVIPREGSGRLRFSTDPELVPAPLGRLMEG